jgi:hypothetical protein
MTHLARWKLLADWPAGPNVYLGAGEIIEASVRVSDGALAGPPTWHGQPLPSPLPMECSPLTQEAADLMSVWYPASLHLLRPGPGVTIRKFFNV